jgi:sugar lactone lactonase YvrE
VSPRPKIEPVVWRPPVLSRADRRRSRSLPPLTVFTLHGCGPEDVVVDEQGQVFTGVDDGRILRIAPDGLRIDTVADTGGRPLGIELYRDGGLLVCDSARGLLAVDPRDGSVRTLVARGEHDLRFCNNAAVAADGTIYFSDSSQRVDVEHWKADLLEHAGTGRLLRRAPDGEVEVLLDGLHFANGVALAPDESFLVVAQTGMYRLDRLWLTGERAGSCEVFADNLPGFPDNMSTGSDGLLWLALANPRNQLLDRVSPWRPVVRKLLWALPEALQPQARKTIWVRALDLTGAVVHEFYGTGAEFFMSTGVRERAGTVYLGSLQAGSVATLPVPEPAPATG